MMCIVKDQPETAWREDVDSVNSPATDEALLLRYRTTGNREDFARLVSRYERELFNYLRRYLGNAEMADDVFQATFLQIHLKADKFEEGRRFRPWMYTIATNQAIDAQRRNKRHKMASLDRSFGSDGEDGGLSDLMAGEEAAPLDALDLQEQREAVTACVNRLPETLKSVVTLVYYQGMKYREAADVLDLPVGTVKSRMHTAIKSLNELCRNVLPAEN